MYNPACKQIEQTRHVDWGPKSEAVRRPTPSPAEGGHQKRQRSSSASTSATSPVDVEPAQVDFMPVRQPGPQRGTRVATTPLQFFRLFFTDAVLGTLMANTKPMPIEQRGMKGKKVVWHNIGVADNFFFTLPYMGMVKCSMLVDYWKGPRLYSPPFPAL